MAGLYFDSACLICYAVPVRMSLDVPVLRTEACVCQHKRSCVPRRAVKEVLQSTVGRA
jgi:hypothetical protein